MIPKKSIKRSDNRNQSRPKILDSRLLASSWRLSVFEDELSLHGKGNYKHARIDLPHSVTVVAVRESDGKMPLVKQYRHGAREFFWELPAGYIEDGESPAACVKREFREEVGYELRRPRKLSSVFLQPSRSNQVVHIFEGLVGRRMPAEPDSVEDIHTEFFTREEALEVISKKPSAIHLLALSLKP